MRFPLSMQERMLKKQELEKAIHYFGDIAKMARALKIDRKTVSNWFNNLDIRIPYHHLVDLICEAKCVLSIYHLGPEYKPTNNNFILFVSKNKSKAPQMMMHEVFENKCQEQENNHVFTS